MSQCIILTRAPVCLRVCPAGGFGKVYLAQYEGRPVAVKVVTGDASLDFSQPLSSFDQWRHDR